MLLELCPSGDLLTEESGILMGGCLSAVGNTVFQE